MAKAKTIRKPRFTAAVPKAAWVEAQAKELGLDTTNPEFSSPELTQRFVAEFNRLNKLKSH